MYSTKLLRGIIVANILLVLVIGVYGELTHEWFWRELSHYEWPYDYLWWFGLAFNGPSGLAAALVSSRLVHGGPGYLSLQEGYWAQYGLWLLLLTLQWWGYHAAAVWSYGHRRREIALYIIALGITLAGCWVAYNFWIRCEPGGLYRFTSCYSPLLMAAGLPLSGLIIVAYSRFGRRSNPPA